MVVKNCALGKIVGRAGDISVAVGGKHAGFAIGHAAEVGAEIKALDLIDILSVEAGVGKIPFGNESRTPPLLLYPQAAQNRSENQSQAQI